MEFSAVVLLHYSCTSCTCTAVLWSQHHKLVGVHIYETGTLSRLIMGKYETKELAFQIV